MKSFTQREKSLMSQAGLFKKLLPIPLFYIMAALVIYLLEKWEPGGPCGIGTGMFTLLFVFVPVSAGLALYNIRRTTVNRKINATIAVLHIAGLFLVLKIFW